MRLGDINTEIWLHILRSGQWWTALEIDTHFRLPSGFSRRRLHDMQRNGCLAKKPIEGAHSVRFSVTPSCLVPRGMKIGQVQVRLQSDEEARR